MSRTADEQASNEHWRLQYMVRQSQPFIEIEREVFGCDYGATSWTDRAEAERFAKLLRLEPRLRVLDIGAGSGWPGLYLAGLTGCDTTLVDVPMEGLRRASARAAAEGIAGKCRTAVADGAHLPFADGLFDAVYHCDVLC
jgi:cyclopropane fatty-acyl-phospholipid synthase-like methyltransferase